MSSTAAAAASSILVFGATGDIGSRLVRLLAATASIAVTAAVRSLDKAKAKLPHNVKALHVDSADPLSIQQAVADSRADATFLYAQTASAAALDALKAGGIRRIVLLSSCHVGLPGLPQGALAQMHKKPEDAIRALGVTYTFLRADRFASNMLHFAKPIAAVGGKVTLAYPDAPYYVVTADDVASVAATALTTQRFHNKAVGVVGPAVLSDRQQLDVLAHLLGKPVDVQQISRAERAQQLNQTVPAPAVSEAILDYYEWRQQHGADVWSGDELARGSISFE